MHEVLGIRLVKLAQEKSVVRLTDHHDMIKAVDWDVKPNKQTLQLSVRPCFNLSTPSHDIGFSDDMVILAKTMKH